MNRIVERFALLKKNRQKGFIVYIGAGDPDLEATRRLALAFDKAGVDVLELGVPFSDPLADGLVNQLAAQRGLESGATPAKVLKTVRAIRKDSQTPIVLYIYFNLLHRHGFKKFIEDAASAGVDGLLVLDLPPEESENYEAMMREAGLCVIYSGRADDARRPDRIDRETRHGVYLLCVARRRDRDAGEGFGHHRIHDGEDTRAYFASDRGGLWHFQSRAGARRGRVRGGDRGRQRDREPDCAAW